VDKLHKEHELILRVWKYMKFCEQTEKDALGWANIQMEAEKIVHDFSNFGFISDWLISYMKFLNGEI